MGSLVAELAEKLSSATNSIDFDEQTLFLNTSANTVGVGTNAPASKFDVRGTMQVGVAGTGHDIYFYGDTSGKHLLWDQSGDELLFATSTKLSFHDAAGGENILASADGHLEVNAGTTLDITAPTVDINASTLVQIDGPVSVGVDDAGHDVIFYGYAASSNMTWDASGDDLILNDSRLYIDQDDDDSAIVIDSESANQFAIISTAKYALLAEQDISGGYAAKFKRDIAEAGSSALVQILNDHTSDTAGALSIQQDGAGMACNIDQNGNHHALRIDTESTTVRGISVEADALTTGDLARFYSNSSDTSTRSLLNIHNDHASATGTTALKIVQDSPAGAAGVGLALNVQGVNAEVLIGNTGAALEQAVHLGLSKRQNYGNVIISKNLKGVAGADTYKTIGTHGAVGYAAMEFQYGGVTNFYNFSGATTADAVVTPSEKMRITDAGRVGIGTNSPVSTLHVQANYTGGSDGMVHYQSSGTESAMTIETTANTARKIKFGLGSNGVFNNYDETNGRLLSRMNVAGDTEFQPNANGTGVKIVIGYHTIMSKYHDDLYFYKQYGVTAGTNIYALNHAIISDYRLKENIVPLDSAVDRINQLKPYRFNMIATPSQTQDGFLAHEVEDVVPEAVCGGGKDAVETEQDENGDDIETPRYQGVDPGKIVPLLTKAVQELSAKVTALEDA